MFLVKLFLFTTDSFCIFSPFFWRDHADFVIDLDSIQLLLCDKSVGTQASFIFVPQNIEKILKWVNLVLWLQKLNFLLIETEDSYD